MRRASEIIPVPIEWLWRDRVPLGMLTLFSGDPKLGKGLATISLISFLTRGGPPPGHTTASEAGSAILLSAEDDPARSIVPRLRTAVAELSKVHILSPVVEPGRSRADDGDAVERMLTVRGRDLEAIERTAESLGDCRLIVIDPISAYLGDCDEHPSTNVRSMLRPRPSKAAIDDRGTRAGATVIDVINVIDGVRRTRRSPARAEAVASVVRRQREGRPPSFRTRTVAPASRWMRLGDGVSEALARPPMHPGRPGP
jgi:hypothetical protein